MKKLKPDLKKPDVKMPPVLENLFRDMRDKRLLPIAALLVVGILAVPFLLGGSAPTPASSGTADIANAALASDDLTQPVVLTDSPGLRRYQKRLSSLQRTNPFKQQMATPPQSVLDTQTLEDPSTGPDPGTTTDPGTTLDPGTTTTDPGTTPTDPGTTPTDPATPPKDPGAVLYTVELDVKMGPTGDQKKVEGVKDFDYLPDDRLPLLQYVGGTVEGDSAGFAVSRDVTRVEGDGNCAPSPTACQFLKMGEGDEIRIYYDPEGDGSNLMVHMKLVHINVIAHKVDSLPKADNGSGNPSNDFAAGLAG